MPARCARGRENAAGVECVVGPSQESRGDMIRTTIRCMGISFAAAGIAFVALYSASGLAVTAGTEVSEKRAATIRESARESLTQLGAKASDADLIARATAAFFAAYPTCPAGPELAPLMQEQECREAAWAVADGLVERRYPALDVAALEKEAAEKFPIYEEGDIVEVVFQLNPVRREHVRGVYRGRTQRAVKIGRWTIMVEDIETVKGNEELLQRLDAETSRGLRADYVGQKRAVYEEERSKYRDTVRAVAKREHYRMGAETNEQRGYIYLQDHWLPVAEAIREIAGAEKKALQQEYREALEQRLTERRQAARTVTTAAVAAAVLGPNSSYVNPEVVRTRLAEDLAAAAKLRQSQQESERLQKEQQLAEAKLQEDAKAQAAAKKVAARKAAAPDAGTDTGGDEDVGDGMPVLLLGVIGAFAVLTLVGVLVTLSRRKKGVPEKFFKGKGKLQKDFWSRAEADPEGFKYVAYLLPDMEDAQNALEQSSFLEQGTDGRLRCYQDLMVGFYPHQGKAVCFVGGENLSYALWGEASAVMPELPGAEYFRVSTAPEVLLEIPDVEGALRDDSLQITHVGNRDGEGDDYSQYYVYKAPDRDNAVEFLRRARVDEPGIHVVVETPEGVWGKDLNGIYQE